MLATVFGLIMFALWAFQISLETFWSTVMLNSHTSWWWNFTDFMLSTCAKLLQSLRYFGLHFTQIPHTYSVSQPLSSHVSLSRNRHRRIAEIDVYTQGFDISLLLYCQLVPNCLNDWGILDCTWHRYPTHILSPNHCHRMCVGQGIGTEE